MPVPGALYGSRIGGDSAVDYVVLNGGATTYAMAALNTGWCARFMATQNKDVYSIKLNYSAVTLGTGIQNIRIETIDTATGKPTGTLYDANATLLTAGLTPVVGWNTFTFAVVPTTKLTVGTEYAIVVLTTVIGTTMTLRSHAASALITRYPIAVLTAADGTTRSNFAEVASSLPLASLLLDDGTEDPMGLFPYATLTSNNIFGTAGVALKITTAGTALMAGAEFMITKVGTPAGDLRVRVFDSADAPVTNSSVTIDKDSLLTNASLKRSVAQFGGLASLVAGAYRVVFDSASSANASNCWRISSMPPVTTTVAPADMVLSTCPAVGTPVWTDSATADQVPVRLWLDSLTAGAGGGASNVIGG